MENKESEAGKDTANGRGLSIRLAVWGGCLGALLVASVYLDLPKDASSRVGRTAFVAAMTAAYSAIFCHCLMRFAYSRWLSWFLFTAGFAGLASTSATSLVFSVLEPLLMDRLDLLRSAMLPVAVLLFLSAAQAAKGRRKKSHAGWKYYARVLLLSGGVIAAWQSGAIDLLRELVSASTKELGLAVSISASAGLLALIHRVCNLERSTRDELVVPAAYWAVAVLLGCVLSVGAWNLSRPTWMQAGLLEVAGVVALLVGLSLGNERAHREAAEELADLQAMQHVSWSLVGASDIDELSDALTCAISHGFDAPFVALYLPGETDQQLVISAVHGVDDPSVATGKTCSLERGFRPGFHNGHTARAYASGNVEVVSEIYSDVEFLPWRLVARNEGMVVSVPLPYQSGVIGVLNLFLPGARSVGPSKLQLLMSIAAAVSPAIENMRVATTSQEELMAA